jgi:hypothetical protein
VISLAIGATSLFIAWQNSRLQDIDQLRAKCDYGFTAHIGYEWPASYPVPDSVRPHYYPLLLIRCVLANPGRRTVSVTDLLVGGRPPSDKGEPIDPDLYQTPDSSILSLPLNLGPGESHRMAMLIVQSRRPGREEGISLLTPRGNEQVVAIDWREVESKVRARTRDTSKSSYPPPKDEERWQVQLRFLTALGARAEYTASWIVRTGLSK